VPKKVTLVSGMSASRRINHRPKTCNLFDGSNAFPKERAGCKLPAH
jgi:hypothetical protein